jgi:hypothetical protein
MKNRSAIAQSVLGLLVFAALLFLPAGTFDYWQGWVFIVVFAVTTVVPAAYLGRKVPPRSNGAGTPGRKTRPGSCRRSSSPRRSCYCPR